MPVEPRGAEEIQPFQEETEWLKNYDQLYPIND